MKRSVSLLPLAVAACVPASRPPAASPAPTRVVAVPAPAPVPALGPDWQDWPVTPGAWTYRRYTGSSATFSTTGDESGTLLVITCSPGGPVELNRTAPGTGPLTVRTSNATRALPVRSVASTTTRATLQPTDPLLDAIAFSRGRFTVEQAGTAPLVLPPHAEVARVVEDCRP